MKRKTITDKITDELKIMNNNIKGILEAIKRQQKTKVEQVFDMACAVVGILGIIAITDIIIKWIGG
jgi:CHASE3 domain sensor protein